MKNNRIFQILKNGEESGIFANLFDVWLSKRQADSHICLYTQFVVLCFLAEIYGKKSDFIQIMPLERGGVFHSLSK